MTGFRASKRGQWGLDGAVEGWVPGPDDLRQGDGRRLPRGGVRRPRGRHVAARARTDPSTRPGTLSGNPIATTAGLATLRLATDDVYDHLLRVGDTIKAATSDALSVAGVEHVVQSAGTMFSVFFTSGPVRDFADASRTDTGAYAAFFHAMLDAGVYLPPSAYEAWFLSAAHDERAVSAVLDALPAAARAAAATQA